MHSAFGVGKEWRGMKASGQNFKKTSNFIKMETEGDIVTSYAVIRHSWQILGGASGHLPHGAVHQPLVASAIVSNRSQSQAEELGNRGRKESHSTENNKRDPLFSMTDPRPPHDSPEHSILRYISQQKGN